MLFTPLGFAENGLSDAFRIDLERREDERGFFARAACAREFEAHGLPVNWVQMNLSFNTRAGTLRGLHFQRAPAAEGKIVRCIRGAIFDVIVDLRAASPRRGQWTGARLDAENRSALYVPPGFAHGFQTLEPDTELLYLHDTFFDASHEGGLNALDSRLGIPWPLEIVGRSARDASLPGLDEMEPTGL